MLFIGIFCYVSNQEEEQNANRRHGEFNLMVEAASAEIATDMFKTRIQALQNRRDFFEGDCSIFFTQLLEFDGVPRSEAMILNYKSFAGDPVMPFIGCIIPSDQVDACRIYDWEDSTPGIDGKDQKIFLEFKSSAGE
ncbi:hypothetical protein ACFL03_06735 [Thermodesulfobacteriota bacterium]